MHQSLASVVLRHQPPWVQLPLLSNTVVETGNGPFTYTMGPSGGGVGGAVARARGGRLRMPAGTTCSVRMRFDVLSGLGTDRRVGLAIVPTPTSVCGTIDGSATVGYPIEIHSRTSVTNFSWWANGVLVSNVTPSSSVAGQLELRVSRIGDNFQAAYSTDAGVSWTDFGALLPGSSIDYYVSINLGSETAGAVIAASLRQQGMVI